MRLRRIEGAFRPTPDGTSAIAHGGMVASAFPAATDAGRSVLAEGGNAVDAAIAVAFALSVCEPQASGIGGQSLVVLHHEGRTVALDGSSRVPSLAHHESLDHGDHRIGHRAATVPSTPAVFAWMHERWGSLPWHRLLEPAVTLARDGYEITDLQSRLQQRELDNFAKVPNRSGARYFLDDGKPFGPGDVFRQRDLAAVLAEIATNGVASFYSGDIAAAIDEDMRANDGFLRREDLALVPWPVELRPLWSRYRRLRFATLPPPGAGQTLALVMMMLERLPSRLLSELPPEAYHFVAETFRKAFLRRVDRPFDPRTYPQEADRRPPNRTVARRLAASIVDEMDPDLPLEDPFGADTAETTHFSVMDRDGGAVSVTQSIELVYGSKAAADGLGFLYNDYLRALELTDPSHPHFLRPNAVPWSTAAPTVAFVDGEPWLALGSPGSERIFSTIAQVLSHLVDDSASLTEAIDRPRMHCSIGGRVSMEVDRFDPDVVAYLRDAGYPIRELEPWSFRLGCVQAVMRCRTRSAFQGVADRRRDGTAAGPP